MSNNNNNNIERQEQQPDVSATEGDAPPAAAEGVDVTNDQVDHPPPTPRHRRKEPKDEKKKRKKKQSKKKKREAKSSYFGAPGQDDDEGDGGQRRNEGLLRAPSVGYLPPPPRGFSLSNNNTDNTHLDDGKMESKELQIYDEHEGRPIRPGVMRVRVQEDGEFDIESPRTIIDLTSSEERQEGEARGGYRDDEDLLQTGSSTEDFMAQAELVNDAVISVTAAPDYADELQDRVERLEKAKNQRQKGKRIFFLSSKKRILDTILFLALVGGTIGLIVYFVATKGDPPTEAPSLSPSTPPSSYPTASPSQFPSPLPTLDVEELWTELIQSQSPTTTFDNETSPERMAMDWMISDPFTRSLFNDTDRVLQRFALAVFWHATGTSLGGDWLTDTNECNWGGAALRCDVNDTVRGFFVAGFGLQGTLPKELGFLSSIQHLGLDGNAFEGTIPTEIGKLTSMTLLDLARNVQLQGTIPTEIGLLTSLSIFVISEVPVKGSIPTQVGLLSELELFVIYAGNITSTIPSEIGLLTAMTMLDIADNSLSGTIPSELASLVNMNELQMYGNELSGTVPSSLCSPSRVLSIDCGPPIACTCCSGEWPGFIPCEQVDSGS